MVLPRHGGVDMREARRGLNFVGRSELGVLGGQVVIIHFPPPEDGGPAYSSWCDFHRGICSTLSDKALRQQWT